MTTRPCSLPLLEDIDIVRESLEPKLFPGVSSSVGVHSGFAGSQSRSVLPELRPCSANTDPCGVWWCVVWRGVELHRSAADVLAAVKAGISQYNAQKVTVTGHSLGT